LPLTRRQKERLKEIVSCEDPEHLWAKIGGKIIVLLSAGSKYYLRLGKHFVKLQVVSHQ
jgi:hypothetical protein